MLTSCWHMYMYVSLFEWTFSYVPAVLFRREQLFNTLLALFTELHVVRSVESVSAPSWRIFIPRDAVVASVTSHTISAYWL